ncbi:tryptophan synthase subunit beta like protein [Chromatiaceae bacterium AAb-1]|nr:tryptophan synthase subunit beta like protein [Chromatiaceae bacterium AAb-1]
MFVKRDANGQIVGVSQLQEEGYSEEEINPNSPELIKFLYGNLPETSAAIFRNSDTEMIRVLEDLLDLLTAKGIIQFTDMPEAAQQKVLSRQSIRKRINGLNLLSDNPDEETINLR